MWPNWAIFCSLGSFLKPLATINLLKLPTFLGVKFYHFSSEIIFGQLLQTFGNFIWSHCLPSSPRKLATILQPLPMVLTVFTTIDVLNKVKTIECSSANRVSQLQCKMCQSHPDYPYSQIVHKVDCTHERHLFKSTMHH